MTGWGRALAGAAFGALLTLLLHPVSRPFLLGSTQRVRVEAMQSCISSYAAQPEPPRDLLGASLWVQLALERDVASETPLRAGEVSTVLRIIDAANAQDPDNAYWNQARAVLLMSAGQALPARAAWIRASRAARWNDYQSDRLFQSRRSLATLLGAEQAWQLAYVHHHRSRSAAIAIERVARQLLGDADPGTSEGLAIRFATLANGDLLRTGARSVAIGRRGADIVNLTTYPAAQTEEAPSPRKLWTGQVELLNSMATRGPEWADRAERARTIFRENESWLALIGFQDVRKFQSDDTVWNSFMIYDDPQRYPEFLSLSSIVTSGLTGTIAIVAVTGGLIYACGLIVGQAWKDRNSVAWPWVAAIGLLLGTVGYLLTRDLFTTVASALCASLLGIAPSNVRKTRPQELGPLFVFFNGLLAILFGASVCGFLLGTTPAAAGLLPLLGVPQEYYLTPLLLGLSALILGILLLAVPMWGLAQRIAIPHVLSLALQRFGATLGFGGLALGILLTPALVYADRELDKALSQLVGNEPVVYLMRR